MVEIGCLVTVVQISWEIHPIIEHVDLLLKPDGSTIIVAKRVTGLFWLLLNVVRLK